MKPALHRYYKPNFINVDIKCDTLTWGFINGYKETLYHEAQLKVKFYKSHKHTSIIDKLLNTLKPLTNTKY